MKLARKRQFAPNGGSPCSDCRILGSSGQILDQCEIWAFLWLNIDDDDASFSRQKADLAVTVIGITDRREQDMDFSFPFYFEAYTVVFTSPASATKSIQLYTKPFSIFVWYISNVLFQETCCSCAFLCTCRAIARPDKFCSNCVRPKRSFLLNLFCLSET